MIVTSEVSKQLIMLELTVPWEERIEEANERKCAKCQELVEECRERGWRTFYEPIEVGCRGFAWHSLCKVLSRLGVTGWPRRWLFNPQTKPQRKPQGGFGLRGLIRGLLLGRKSGHWQTPAGSPGWGCMMCCETRNTQWSQDTSLRMRHSASIRCFLHSSFINMIKLNNFWRYEGCNTTL